MSEVLHGWITQADADMCERGERYYVTVYPDRGDMDDDGTEATVPVSLRVEAPDEADIREQLEALADRMELSVAPPTGGHIRQYISPTAIDEWVKQIRDLPATTDP